MCIRDRRNSDYGEGYYGEVARATLPRDRWGAIGLYPKITDDDLSVPHGSVWSAPVRLPEQGCALFLNADHAQQLSVEISDAKFNLLPNFSGTQSGQSATDDGLDCPVSWSSASLDSLAGQTVRFKINFTKAESKDPRLFAVYLRTSQ